MPAILVSTTLRPDQSSGGAPRLKQITVKAATRSVVAGFQSAATSAVVLAAGSPWMLMATACGLAAGDVEALDLTPQEYAQAESDFWSAYRATLTAARDSAYAARRTRAAALLGALLVAAGVPNNAANRQRAARDIKLTLAEMAGLEIAE